MSRSTLRPQPHGAEGEIAISGPTVLKKYLDNPVADKKSYFFLTQKGDTKSRYFFNWRRRCVGWRGFPLLERAGKGANQKGW